MVFSLSSLNFVVKRNIHLTSQHCTCEFFLPCSMKYKKRVNFALKPYICILINITPIAGSRGGELNSSGVLFLTVKFNFNCCEEYVSSIAAFILTQMHVLMASKNLLVQGIWQDEALITHSSLINSFTEWQYHL